MNDMVNLIPTCIVCKKTILGWFFSILKNNVYTCIEGGCGCSRGGGGGGGLFGSNYE
jgi:hypothetical protein